MIRLIFFENLHESFQIWDKIFNYLTYTDLLNIRQVCHAAHKPAIYSILQRSTFILKPETQLKYLEYAKEWPIKYLKILPIPIEWIQQERYINSLSEILTFINMRQARIESLSIPIYNAYSIFNEPLLCDSEEINDFCNKTSIKYGMLYNTIYNMPALRSLHLIGMNIVEVYGIIKKNFNQLEEIICEKCDLYKYSRDTTMLSYKKDLHELSNKTSSLKVFKFGLDRLFTPKCVLLDDFWLDLFTILAKSLKSLSISTRLPPDSVIQFFKKCDFKLTELKVFASDRSSIVLNYILGLPPDRVVGNTNAPLTCTLEVLSFIGHFRKTRLFNLNLKNMKNLKVCLFIFFLSLRINPVLSINRKSMKNYQVQKNK